MKELIYYNKPTRRAILFGSPGHGKDYLFSVSTDIEKMKKFLLSSRGGKWKEEEIMIIWHADLTTFTTNIFNALADYVYIYYAGHGHQNIDDRLICLTDADVSDFYLLNDSPRQLVVLDCCREKEYATISGIPKDKEWLPFDGYYAEREAFDNYILQSPAGKKIVHATKAGLASYEYPRGRGGVFTTNLLIAATTHKGENNFSPISIEVILVSTENSIRESGDTQTPEIVYSEGQLTVPFALTVKQNFALQKPIKTTKQIKRLPTLKKLSDSGLIKFGLIGLALFVLADSFE